MPGISSFLSSAGKALMGGANIVGALKGGPDYPDPVKPDPFKSPLSTGSYWFGGGQLRSTTGDVLSQERALRGRLGDLAKTVAPGMSQQRQALSSLFGAGRQQAMGTLRANLQQRGLLGASFANDQLSQLDAEFRMQEAMAIAQTYQTEFDKTLQTIQAEGVLKEQQATREMAELGIATDFLKDVNQIQTAQSKLLAQLAGEQALQTAGLDPNSLDLPPPPSAPAPAPSTTDTGVGTSYTSGQMAKLTAAAGGTIDPAFYDIPRGPEYAAAGYTLEQARRAATLTSSIGWFK